MSKFEESRVSREKKLIVFIGKSIKARLNTFKQIIEEFHTFRLKFS